MKYVIIRRIELGIAYTAEEAAWVPQCLHRIASSKIEEISLCIRYPAGSDFCPSLDGLDWVDLGRRLGEPRFSLLRRVNICWERWQGSQAVKYVEGVLKHDKLAELYQRGLLRFEEVAEVS